MREVRTTVYTTENPDRSTVVVPWGPTTRTADEYADALRESWENVIVIHRDPENDADDLVLADGAGISLVVDYREV